MGRISGGTWFGTALGLVFLVVPVPVRADTIEIWPQDSFEAAVEALNPGNTLVVHAGTYEGEGRISLSVRGTETAPVTVAGADGEDRPLISRPASAPVQP